MKTLPKLPIGIQTFSKIRPDNYLYVDKTAQIYRLITSGEYFFLSRPRRFGKSLTLSTIKSIYQGEQALFAGLWIEDKWDWERIRPVIHISFSSVDYEGAGLEKGIVQILQLQAEEHGISLQSQYAKSMFAELIRKLGKDNQVVILIDEYDKPIIDYLEDKEQAKANQAILRTFYSVIKDSDPYIEFLLITGISKFSKVSIFSVLNNLNDITIDPNFADLTGYTQEELEASFEPYMHQVEENLSLGRTELLAKLRHWYNGYTWGGQVYVYNPFSVLNFFQKGIFRNYWFETATPTFLLQLMREQEALELDDIILDELAFATFDIDHLNVWAILFQTGYLTIKGQDELGLYQLGYPNAEVEKSMLIFLMGDWANMVPARTTPVVVQMYRAFLNSDMELVIQLIKSIFKNIPSHIFISEAESYYHSLVYLTFLLMGHYTESEVNTNNGRLDCVVQTLSHIYILEFKLDQSAEAAINQMKERGYAEKYALDPRPKILLGINFSRSEKTIDGWLMETVC